MDQKTQTHPDKQSSLPHIFMGIVILLHGIGHLETHFYNGILFMLVGFIFLAFAILHKKLVTRFAYIDSIFHVLEGILAIIVGVGYFQDNKKFIPYLYILAALFYFSAGLRKYYLTKKKTAGVSSGTDPVVPDETAIVEEPARI